MKKRTKDLKSLRKQPLINKALWMNNNWLFCSVNLLDLVARRGYDFKFTGSIRCLSIEDRPTFTYEIIEK